MLDIFDLHCFYRRDNSDTVFVRDSYGRRRRFTIRNGVVRPLPGAGDTLGPVFGRVDFANRARFTGRTRSQTVLAQQFTDSAPLRSTGWVSLATTASTTPRTPNQGMDLTMAQLTGSAMSATGYAGWYAQQHPGSVVDATVAWEWCHLLAHSLGGQDNADNIVAAVRGNNTEQLAIESALHLYRPEDSFALKVTAAVIDAGQGQHLANAICYEIRCVHGGDTYRRFLDCLNAPNPSEIHYYEVYSSVAKWANRMLQAYSDTWCAVTPTERNALKAYLRS